MNEYGRMPNFDTHGFTWPGGPDYEPPAPLRCEQCGGFLPYEPTYREPWEETAECDGTATAATEEREGVLLDILGPGTDTMYFSACGSPDGPHEPHSEVVAAGTTFKTICRRCGYENVDAGL